MSKCSIARFEYINGFLSLFSSHVHVHYVVATHIWKSEITCFMHSKAIAEALLLKSGKMVVLALVSIQTKQVGIQKGSNSPLFLLVCCTEAELRFIHTMSGDCTGG